MGDTHAPHTRPVCVCAGACVTHHSAYDAHCVCPDNYSAMDRSVCVSVCPSVRPSISVNGRSSSSCLDLEHTSECCPTCCAHEFMKPLATESDSVSSSHKVVHNHVQGCMTTRHVQPRCTRHTIATHDMYNPGVRVIL